MTSEHVAWACVVWLIAGCAWLRGRSKPRRLEATPAEVAAYRYECEKNQELERQNSRLADLNMKLGLRVFELEQEAVVLRRTLRAESRFYRVLNDKTGLDITAGAREGMGV